MRLVKSIKLREGGGQLKICVGIASVGLDRPPTPSDCLLVAAEVSSDRAIPILPNPMAAWALARFRSNASACSHSAMPSEARLVNMLTSPSHIWPPAWSGTEDKALVSFASAAAKDATGSGTKEFTPSMACARRSNERVDIVGIGGERAIEKAARARHSVGGRHTLVEPSQSLKIEVHRVGGRACSARRASAATSSVSSAPARRASISSCMSKRSARGLSNLLG
jgi:hypothetical protein